MPDITDLATTINRDALQWILGTRQGRRVLWDLLAVTGIYRQPRVVGDPGATDFNCGGLNVGLILYADCLTVSPDLTAMMIKEQASYENTAAAEALEEPGRGDGKRDYAESGSSPEPDNNSLGLGRWIRPSPSTGEDHGY